MNNPQLHKTMWMSIITIFLAKEARHKRVYVYSSVSVKSKVGIMNLWCQQQGNGYPCEEVETESDVWGAGYILSLGLGDDYMRMFTL